MKKGGGFFSPSITRPVRVSTVSPSMNWGTTLTLPLQRLYLRHCHGRPCIGHGLTMDGPAHGLRSTLWALAMRALWQTFRTFGRQWLRHSEAQGSLDLAIANFAAIFSWSCSQAIATVLPIARIYLLNYLSISNSGNFHCHRDWPFQSGTKMTKLWCSTLDQLEPRKSTTLGPRAGAGCRHAGADSQGAEFEADEVMWANMSILASWVNIHPG